jgi:hypothetical protein
MTTLPMLFGYVRLREPSGARHLPELREQIQRYAAQEGYSLADVLVEHSPGGTSAFADLLELLKRFPASRAVVPSHAHLAELPTLRRALVDLFERETGNSLLVLPSEPSNAESVPGSTTGAPPTERPNEERAVSDAKSPLLLSRLHLPRRRCTATIFRSVATALAARTSPRSIVLRTSSIYDRSMLLSRHVVTP